VPTNRHAADRRAWRRLGKPETFKFLGPPTSASQIGAEDVVAVAGGVRQQVLQRDRGFGITQSWRAVSIEPFQYFRILDHRLGIIGLSAIEGP
jgi:hypothetical protein